LMPGGALLWAGRETRGVSCLGDEFVPAVTRFVPHYKKQTEAVAGRPVFAKITLFRRGPRSVRQTGDVPPYLYLRPRGLFNVAQRKEEPAGRETKSNVYFATPGNPPDAWTNYRNIETLGRDDKVRFAFFLTGAALRHGASNVIFANTGHGVDINRWPPCVWLYFDWGSYTGLSLL
jgi:hypothetical protein